MQKSYKIKFVTAIYIPPNEIIIDDITYKIVNSLNLYTCWNFILQMATLDSAFKYLS